jgi:hypothetical protein
MLIPMVESTYFQLDPFSAARARRKQSLRSTKEACQHTYSHKPFGDGNWPGHPVLLVPVWIVLHPCTRTYSHSTLQMCPSPEPTAAQPWCHRYSESVPVSHASPCVSGHTSGVRKEALPLGLLDPKAYRAATRKFTSLIRSSSYKYMLRLQSLTGRRCHQPEIPENC